MAKARAIEGLHEDLPFTVAAALTVRTRTDELFAGADGVLDTHDIERVHDMRVATRRLRAVLEIYAPCFEKDEHKAALKQVKGLADALGARRDPDVQLEDLRVLAADLDEADRPGVELFAARIRDAQQEGNVTLARALEAVERDGLRGRLDALADRAAADTGHPDATSDGS